MSNKSSSYIITDLILGNTKYAETETVLVLSAESVDLIEAIAEVAKTVHVYDMSASALERVQRVVRRKNIVFSQDVYPQAESQFDTALVIVPKGRDLGRALLWSAMRAVKVGGEIYIAGANDGGAKTLIKDAELLFGTANVLDYKKSHRIAGTINHKIETYPAEWGMNPLEIQTRQFSTPLGDVSVATRAGIFSWSELDEGTEFLLENTTLRHAKAVLDMGCGNGVIGAVLAPKVEQVVMVDDNLLALSCAKATVELNHLTNVTVMASDMYTALEGQKFDLILCNPPFHDKFETSANIAQRMIQNAPAYLNRGGRLLLVANNFLKYEPIFEEHFSQWTLLAVDSKFKVLEGIV